MFNTRNEIPTSHQDKTPGVPYWRLSGFYLFYFGLLGVFLPYWSPYLKSIGFNAEQIGILTAILACTKIIAPNIWAWIADHRGRRMMIVRFASFIACLLFAGILFTTSFAWMAIIIILFGFFWNATLPQFEATTLSHLGESTHAYTRIRLWGSIGFIVTVWCLGKYFEVHSIEHLPIIILTFLFFIFIGSLFVPENAAGHLNISGGSLVSVLKQQKVSALLIACFLMQFSHAPYYTFYSIYLEENAYSKSFIGSMWALSVLAEVAIFLCMPRLITWLGLRTLLLISLVFASIRWITIGYCINVVELLIVAQLLHAATFGIYHAVAIQFIHRYFSGRLQGRGQALYSSMSFGAGLAIGSLVVGYSWNTLGSTISFQGAAAVSLIAFIIVLLRVKE